MKARVITRKKGYAVRIASKCDVQIQEVRELAHEYQELPCVVRAVVRGKEIFLKTRQKGRKVRRLLESVANKFLGGLVSTPASKRVHRAPYVRTVPAVLAIANSQFFDTSGT